MKRPPQKKQQHSSDGNPRFGRLLVVLVAAVAFCVLLTWIMASRFPDFPNF